MATFHECRDATAADLLAGLGTPVNRGGRDYLITTCINRNGGNRRYESVAERVGPLGSDSRGREQPDCSASGDMIDVDASAFSVLRRATSASDGNNFYSEGLTELAGDNSVQYGREACHAIMALEGLNVVPEDLATAALMGRTAHDVIRPGDASLDDPRDALARVIVRMVADGASSVDAARKLLEDVVDRATRLLG